LSLDNNTRKIISTSYTDDKTRIYWKDKTWEKNYEFLKKKFLGREVTFQSSTRDYKKFLIATYGDKYAPEAYFFNPEKNELIFQYTPRTALKKVEQHLSAMTPVTYKSSDGLEIPAYLTVPQGKEAKNLPVVILVHGGPKGPRDNWGYDPQVQFLANRGYAVLQPNFRASGGYGKQFQNAGDLQWGKLMQDDITWGVKYLIEKGTADKNKVAIMGGSYGGYATLAGLAFTPDLYACGVDIVGPSNIFTLLESIPAYWEAGRAFLHGMVGDPNTEEGKKLIKDASPLFSVDKINKPLMIIQGANDPRVKKAESDQIVIALRDKGKPVTYLLAEDEGHGFAKPVNRMAMYAETEKFLASVLGGRFQPDIPEEVAKRLKEITVDIKTVTYAPKTAVTNAAAMPSVNSTLKALTLNYDVLLEVQGQQIPMATTRTVAKKGNNWLIKEETKGALGNINDEMEYTESFVPVARNMEQMGQQMSLKFNGQNVAVSAMGQNMQLTMNGAYISDGPGMDQLLAGLPLANNYELVFDMPNLTTMKTKQAILKVIGKESLNGSNCWKVVVAATENENDKTTFWINEATKVADKIEAVLPAMGNAKMTYTRK
jgi:dienelactone hydrolase